jgi:Flp pilus assembly protein TadG
MQDRSNDDPASGLASGKRAPRWPQRLWRDQSGASLLEFSLIALPFFLLLYGTFEVGFVYWASQELEHAASHGARLVRTGGPGEGADQAQHDRGLQSDGPAVDALEAAPRCAAVRPSATSRRRIR